MMGELLTGNDNDLKGPSFDLRRHKKTPQFLAGFLVRYQKSLQTLEAAGNYMPMPPIPPMPPMSGMPPAPDSSLGASETMHSVVNIKEATDAAFCKAVRVTLVGSKMPISIMSP
jgi:hypothetical protein